MIRYLKKIFIFLLLLFAILELSVRLFYPHPSRFVQRDPFVGSHLKPGIDVVLNRSEGSNGGKYHFKTNSFGFVDAERRVEKPDGIFRIVNLGDSFTEGLDTDYDKTFSYLLNSDSDKIESLNFGLSGGTTIEQRMVYKFYAKKFNPDMVILWVDVGNDVLESLKYKTGADYVKSVYYDSTAIKSFIKRFYLPHFLLSKLDSAGSGIANEFLKGIRLLFDNTEESRKAYQATKEQILKFAEEVIQRNGKKFLVVLLPIQIRVDPEAAVKFSDFLNSDYDFDKPNKEFKEMFKDEKIDFIDLTEDFEKQCRGGCDLYHDKSGHAHFSEAGHALAAKVVSEYLAGKENPL